MPSQLFAARFLFDCLSAWCTQRLSFLFNLSDVTVVDATRKGNKTKVLQSVAASHYSAILLTLSRLFAVYQSCKFYSFAQQSSGTELLVGNVCACASRFLLTAAHQSKCVRPTYSRTLRFVISLPGENDTSVCMPSVTLQQMRSCSSTTTTRMNPTSFIHRQLLLARLWSKNQ